MVSPRCNAIVPSAKAPTTAMASQPSMDPALFIRYFLDLRRGRAAVLTHLPASLHSIECRWANNDRPELDDPRENLHVPPALKRGCPEKVGAVYRARIGPKSRRSCSVIRTRSAKGGKRVSLHDRLSPPRRRNRPKRVPPVSLRCHCSPLFRT